MVPRVGIEPTLPKKPDFESGASTSSATPAIFRLGIIAIESPLGKSYFLGSLSLGDL